MIWLALLVPLGILGVIGLIFNEMLKPPPTISWGGDPDPNCNLCYGGGVINAGDEHFECDCTCTMLIERRRA